MGLGFLGDLINHYDTDMIGLGRMMIRNPFSSTPAILYHAHRHDCLRKGIPIDFDLHHVEDWIEELDNWRSDKNIEALLGILLDSIQKYVKKAEGPAKEEKKN